MTYFIVTVDVEEQFEWGVDFRKEYGEGDVSNVEELIKFQFLCDEYNVKPTYLIDYPVLANKNSSSVIKELKKRRCELGTHLHTWCNPPFEEEICERNTYADNLDIRLVEKKMKVLNKKFIDTLGMAPKTFKSGRYGINNKIFGLLIKQGYKVDTSAVPFNPSKYFSRSNKLYGRVRPFFVRLGKKSILELPASDGFNFKNFRLLSEDNLLMNSLKRINVVKRIRLSPEGHSYTELRKICDVLIAKDVPVLHLELHSSDLIVGGAPYVKNKKELKEFYEKLENVFNYVINVLGCNPVGCSDVKITRKVSYLDLDRQSKS